MVDFWWWMAVIVDFSCSIRLDSSNGSWAEKVLAQEIYLGPMTR
jgi:hypothetical protein